MEVLLLAGYRNQPIGIETLENGECWIDHQIRSLQQIGLTPIVVLSGAHADDVLRVSRRLESCELVFDANDKESNLFSNLRSGLHATEDACFVMPLEVSIPPETVWKKLKLELLQHGLLTRHHILQLALDEGAAWQHSGFPLLVTAVGGRVILDLENATGLTDERIRYHRLSTVELATVA